MGIQFPIRIPAILKAELVGNAVSLPTVWIVGAMGISEEALATLMVGVDNIPAWVVLILAELRVGRGFFSTLHKVGKDLVGAELLDTFLFRPTLLYACSALFGVAMGGTLGSLAADALYLAAIYLSRRLRG